PSSSPTVTSPLSLHDALPISLPGRWRRSMHLLDAGEEPAARAVGGLHEVPYFFEAHGVGARRLAHHAGEAHRGPVLAAFARDLRSEEHTSELQSLRHLVCRLL